MEVSALNHIVGSRRRALDVFESLGSSMTTGQIVFFLYAVRNEGLCLSDIADSAQVERSTASKYLKYLSDTEDPKHPGLGLLYSYPNPKNKRQKLVVVTPKGHKLLRELQAVD